MFNLYFYKEWRVLPKGGCWCDEKTEGIRGNKGYGKNIPLNKKE